MYTIETNDGLVAEAVDLLDLCNLSRNLLPDVRATAFLCHFGRRSELTLAQLDALPDRPTEVWDRWTGLLEITPKPALRVTQGSKFSPEALAYASYKADLKTLCKSMGFPIDATIRAVHLEVIFGIPPYGYTKGDLNKKGEALCGAVYDRTPDIDNLWKPFGDALAKQDKGIILGSCRKQWGTDRQSFVVATIDFLSQTS